MSAISDLNDTLRRNFTGGRVVMTASVAALPQSDVHAIIRAVRRFNEFGPENDPHGDHDFGLFDAAGQRCLFKIDYYDTKMEYGSPDPADPAVTTRVLTIMLEEDY